MPTVPVFYLQALMPWNMRSISAFICLKSTSPAFPLGNRPTWIGCCKTCRFRRIASRQSRLNRFLWTALPKLPGTNTPYLNRSAFSQTQATQSPRCLRPLAKSRSISVLLFRLDSRGSLFFSTNTSGQSFSAFRSASGQHSPTTLGGHARPITVVVKLLSVRRLECPFHFPRLPQ